MKTVTLKPFLPLYRLTQAKNGGIVRSPVLICQAAVREFKATETGAASAVQSVRQQNQNRLGWFQQVGPKYQRSCVLVGWAGLKSMSSRICTAISLPRFKDGIRCSEATEFSEFTPFKLGFAQTCSGNSVSC